MPWITEYSVQIAAGELLCQLCMEKELLQKTTDFGVARLLTKLESILTSVAVERKLQNEASACQNLCPFVEMIGCSFAPEVALFGLWRIASLCYVNPDVYCPMLFRDGGMSAVRDLRTLNWLSAFNNASTWSKEQALGAGALLLIPFDI